MDGNVLTVKTNQRRGRPKTDFSEPWLAQVWELVIQEVYREKNPARKRNGSPCVSTACQRIVREFKVISTARKRIDEGRQLNLVNEAGELIQSIGSPELLRRRFYAALEAYERPDRYPFLHQRINAIKQAYRSSRGIEVDEDF